MSIKPWNTGTGGCVACEDMPRKSIDIRLTDDPVPEEKGQLRPFPAIRRGRVRAEPEIGSRDWSLVGVGATPQGLKTINICNFQGSAKPIFSAQFFISHLTRPKTIENRFVRGIHKATVTSVSNERLWLQGHYIFTAFQQCHHWTQPHPSYLSAYQTDLCCRCT